MAAIIVQIAKPKFYHIEEMIKFCDFNTLIVPCSNQAPTMQIDCARYKANCLRASECVFAYENNSQTFCNQCLRVKLPICPLAARHFLPTWEQIDTLLYANEGQNRCGWRKISSSSLPRHLIVVFVLVGYARVCERKCHLG